MEQEEKGLKCRGCIHSRLYGWWGRQRFCEVGGFSIMEDGEACIYFSNKPGGTGESITNKN